MPRISAFTTDSDGRQVLTRYGYGSTLDGNIHLTASDTVRLDAYDASDESPAFAAIGVKGHGCEATLMVTHEALDQAVAIRDALDRAIGHLTVGAG